MCFSKLFSHSKFFYVCSVPPFPGSGILCISHIFLVHVMKNIFFLPVWHKSRVMCLHKCKSMCKDVSLVLQMNEAHYPWNIPKENRKDLHSVNFCCELDSENNKYSGCWERFRCHEDISGWIFLTLLGFYFLSSFLGSSNNRKKKIEKKKATVWRYLSICGTDFCFHFTVFYIIKNNSKTWSALCVSLNLQEKFSFVYRFYLYTICDSISQSKTSFWCN